MGNTILTRHHNVPNKSQLQNWGYIFLSVWQRVHTFWAIADAIGYLPYSGGKILLLKTVYFYITEYGRTELALNWKFHPCWLVLIMLECATYMLLEGEDGHQSHSTTNPKSYHNDPLTRHAHWCNSGIKVSAKVALNQLLSKFEFLKVCSRRSNQYLTLLMRPRAWD